METGDWPRLLIITPEQWERFERAGLNMHNFAKAAIGPIPRGPDKPNQFTAAPPYVPHDR